jgi:hypothetical protein
MQLRYRGFEQAKALRVYRFDRVEDRVPTIRYTVAADLALFLKHRVGIQEGPALCARKLTSDLEGTAECEHTLTNDDLLAYVSARTAADERKAAARKPGVRRRPATRTNGVWQRPEFDGTQQG